MGRTRMARFQGEEFPVSEFRAWLDTHPDKAKTMLDTLRYMDERRARELGQDPAIPGYYARARHMHVMLQALNDGVIPNASIVLRTHEELEEFKREVLDTTDDEPDTRPESINEVLRDLLGWTSDDSDLHGKDNRMAYLGGINRMAYDEICDRMIAMRKEAGVDLDEMARRTGMAASVLWAVEHGEACGMLDLLPDYCTALGKTFEIVIRDAG